MRLASGETGAGVWNCPGSRPSPAAAFFSFNGGLVLECMSISSSSVMSVSSSPFLRLRFAAFRSRFFAKTKLSACCPDHGEAKNSAEECASPPLPEMSASRLRPASLPVSRPHPSAWPTRTSRGPLRLGSCGLDPGGPPREYHLEREHHLLFFEYHIEGAYCTGNAGPSRGPGGHRAVYSVTRARSLRRCIDAAAAQTRQRTLAGTCLSFTLPLSGSVCRGSS
jgi:hypothetical protein